MVKGNLKSLKDRFRGNQDARALIENFASLSILKALGLILPLVTLPYLSRVIGVVRFGDIAFASSITVYFMTITDYGFNYTATRELSKNRDNMHYVRELFWNVFYTKLFLLIVSTAIFAILVETIPLLREHRLLLWFTYLSVPCYMLFPEWFFQGIEKMKYITIVNVISKLLFTVLIFFVIKEEADYILHPVLSAFGLLVAGAISQVIVIRKYKVFPTAISWPSIVSTLKSGWNIFFSLIVPNVYTNMSVTYLKIFSGSVGAGLFASGRTFIDLSDQVSTVFSRVFFPFLSRRPDKHSFFSKILLVVSLGMGVALFAGADLLVDLFYSEAFRDSAIVIRIMAICPLFLYLMNAFGTNYLVVIGKDKVYRQVVMWCSFLGLFVAYFSIKYFGYIGAAYTYVIIWGIRGIATWLIATKYKRQLAQ